MGKHRVEPAQIRELSSFLRVRIHGVEITRARNLSRVNKFPRKMSEMASNVCQLPEDLPRAFKDKRLFIEKYARVSDLLNQYDLMEHFPTPDGSLLLTYESDGQNKKAAQEFCSYMLRSTDKTTDKRKWAALRKALASPGHELLCYILNEKEEKLQVLEEREKLVRETFRKELLSTLTASEFCNEFPFSAGDREKIESENNRSGNKAANTLILKYMVTYPNWFLHLLTILDRPGIKKLAKKLREKDPEPKVTDGPARNTRSSDRRPIPIVNDPDKMALNIRDALTTDKLDQSSCDLDDPSNVSFSSGGSSSPTFIGFQAGSGEVASSLSNFSGTSKNSLFDTCGFASEMDEAYSSQTELLKYCPTEMGLKSDQDDCKDSHYTTHENNVVRVGPKDSDAASCRNLSLSNTSENYNGIGFHAIREQRERENTAPSKIDKKLRCLRNSTTSNAELNGQKDAVSSVSENDPEEQTRLKDSREIYRWKHCCQVFLSKEKRDQHMCSGPTSGKQLGSDTPRSLNIYRCKNCLRSFVSAESRDQHICSVVPPSTNPTTARPKNVLFSNTQINSNEQPGKQLGSDTPRSLNIYRCKHCLRSFVSADSRDQHTCSVVPLSTNTTTARPKNVLFSNTQINSNEQPGKQLGSDIPRSLNIYRCKHCLRSFVSADSRDKHMLSCSSFY
ncbi:hypothetical protein RRG08_047042 [Elysia crispata]|uniref:Caspase recruitment domain-containing protein n=1 Tax=Elysia crispata TaxID=231223 RepID=A0AAE1AVQ9_9GAST|nr:hypothetical protein RRG08_047042 [Elysia crispata]